MAFNSSQSSLPASADDVPVWTADVGFESSVPATAYNEQYINRYLGEFVSSCGGIFMDADGRPQWTHSDMVQPLKVPLHPTMLHVSVPDGSNSEGGSRTNKRYSINSFPLPNHLGAPTVLSGSGYWLEPHLIRDPTPLECSLPGGVAAITFSGSSTGSGVFRVSSDGSHITRGKMVFHQGQFDDSVEMVSKFVAGTASAKMPGFPGKIVDFKVMGKFCSTQSAESALYDDLAKIASCTKPARMRSRSSLGLDNASPVSAGQVAGNDANGVLAGESRASFSTNVPIITVSDPGEDEYLDFSQHDEVDEIAGA